MNTPKYGMKHHTITYWQDQAWDLWRYNGINLGVAVFTVPGMLQAETSTYVGHAAIGMARVMTAERLKSVLQGNL